MLRYQTGNIISTSKLSWIAIHYSAICSSWGKNRCAMNEIIFLLEKFDLDQLIRIKRSHFSVLQLFYHFQLQNIVRRNGTCKNLGEETKRWLEKPKYSNARSIKISNIKRDLNKQNMYLVQRISWTTLYRVGQKSLPIKINS